MTRKTLLQQAIERGQNEGLTFIGTVRAGLPSRAKNSNIGRFINKHNLDNSKVICYRGARAGQHATTGYQWAIFIA